MPDSDFGLQAPRLVRDDAEHGRILRGEQTFRRVQSTLWDVPRRLLEMDLAGIERQVISPVPVAMEYAWNSADNIPYARAHNDSLAAACGAADGRLIGLGCLPLQDTAAAQAELDRCRSIGLRGVEIGTRIGDRDLDDPLLRPFWEACDSTGLAVFVHPIDEGRSVVRRSGFLYDLGLGMLTDTALAATALVFGGVLESFPHLRVALAHGCGTFAWAYPRLRLAATMTARSDESGTPAPDELTRRLYADSLVFDDEHLRLLAHRFGADRILLGSDAPFFPGQMEQSVRSVRQAVQSGALLPDATPALLARNALEFLGLHSDAIHSAPTSSRTVSAEGKQT
jgi:aminocarboxymuconate-semialdehyde decarboxylase